MARVPAALALTMLATSTLACVEPPELFTHDIAVESMSPPDGAAAVPVTTEIHIVFSKEIPENVPMDVFLSRGQFTDKLECRISRDPTVKRCRTPEDLLADAYYRVEVDIAEDGEIDGEAIWTTGNPDGLTYDVGPELAVEQLGGNDSAVTVLEDLLLSGEDHLVLVLDRFAPGSDTLPWDGNYLLGNANIRNDKQTGEPVAHIDEESGLTIATRGTLQPDGGFTATADYAALPVSIDGEDMALLLEDVWLTGNIPIDAYDFTRVQNVRLSAAIREAELDDLAESVPEWASVLAEVTGLIEMDVDLDGDGVEDAATFELSSSGDRIELAH